MEMREWKVKMKGTDGHEITVDATHPRTALAAARVGLAARMGRAEFNEFEAGCSSVSIKEV